MDKDINKITMDKLKELISSVSVEEEERDENWEREATHTKFDVDELFDTRYVEKDELREKLSEIQNMRVLYSKVCNQLTKIMIDNQLIFKDPIKQIEKVHFVAIDQIKRIMGVR